MTRKIAPAPGRKVRRPDQGYSVLPEGGAFVAWSPHWDRALEAGDIIVVADEPVETVPAEKAAKKGEQ